MASVIIDEGKMNRFLQEKWLTKTDLSRILGMSDSYMSAVINRGVMTLSTYRLLQKTFDLPYDYFKPDPKPEPKAEQSRKNNSTMIPGYEMTVQVYLDKCRVSLLKDGEEIQYAWAKTNADDPLNLIKSISYAAHMMYKYYEQKTLQE